jgi:hypothetical protein
MMIQRATLLLLTALTLNACAVVPTSSSATPAATQQAQQAPKLNYDMPLNLNNGQSIHLNMHIEGTRISGDLRVEDSPLKTQAFTRTLAFGRYAFTGGFSPPRGFTLTGNFPEPIGRFDLSGTLPTETEPGNFTFTQGNETLSDSLPPLNTLPRSESSPTPITSPLPVETPLPTETPTPIATPLRQWSSEELTDIRNCLSAKTAIYQGAGRSLLIETVAKIAANVSLADNADIPWNAQQRQDKRNEAGAFALNSELSLSSGCVR